MKNKTFNYIEENIFRTLFPTIQMEPFEKIKFISFWEINFTSTERFPYATIVFQLTLKEKIYRTLLSLKMGLFWETVFTIWSASCRSLVVGDIEIINQLKQLTKKIK